MENLSNYAMGVEISMDTFNRIKAKVGLGIECTVINDFQNVSDGLEGEVGLWLGSPNKSIGMTERYMRLNEEQYSPYPSRLWPVIIQAPTGSGKNYFVINLLASEVEEQGGRVLVLTNRVALTLQQRRAADIANGIQPYSYKVYEKCYVSGNMDIIDYQKALQYLDDKKDGTINGITTVVFDEIQFFLADAPFNSETSTILQRLIKRFFWCKRIYMSATPEEVEPIITYEELRASTNAFYFRNEMIIGNTTQKKEINRKVVQKYYPMLPSHLLFRYDVLDIDFRRFFGIDIFLPKIKKYIFESNYRYVKLHFFYDWKTLIDKIKLQDVGDKWLLFVQKREEGRDIKSAIGTDAMFVSAQRGEKEGDTFKRIVEDRKFQKKVLVSTTVLYNGVSLEDKDLKNIAVDSVNRAEVIQMLGRKRFLGNENISINLYVKIPTEDKLARRLKDMDTMGNYVLQFEKYGTGFLAQQWDRENLDDRVRRLIGPVATETGKEICISEYAYTKFANEGSNYTKFLELSKQGNYSMEKEVCKWFNKDFSEEMIYINPNLTGEDRETEEDMPKKEKDSEREEALNKIRSFLDIFVDESPFDVAKCEELCMGLKSLWNENKKYFSTKRPDTRHKPGRLDKNGNLDYTRLVPDIRNILEKIGLQYKVKQTYRENADQSTWRYICLRLEVNE